uniref:Uncharacterized protein n=1 Tax=Mola mola TaxID=94237 RepID=A0A3Q3VYZ2_MOLML
MFVYFSLVLTGVDESQTKIDPINSKCFPAGTVEPGNVTSSLSKDERSRIEAELENNQTSTNITEDDKTFQDQEVHFSFAHCNREALVEYSHTICGKVFQAEMLSVGAEKWCVLQNVIRPYTFMTFCLEELSNMVSCYYPNPDIQDFFLEMHALYFHNCSQGELLLQEAPDGLAIGLTLIPVSLIPALVYLVVRKTNSSTTRLKLS